MLYMSLKECLDCCRHSGILRAEGLSEDEYVDERMGFKPRLIDIKEGEKENSFFSFFPLFNLR